MLSSKHLTTSLLGVLLVLTVINGWFYLHKLMSLQLIPNTLAISTELNETPQPTPTPTATTNASITPLIITPVIPTVTPATKTIKTVCDPKLDVCLNNFRTVYTLQEGYQEHERYWVNQEISLVGQAEKGFEISWQGDSKVKLYSSTNNFKNDQQLPIYLMVEKDITPKGQYQGKIVIKTYVTNNVNEFPITINYVGPSANIHAEKSSVEITCQIDKKQFNGYINCGDYNQAFYFKLYWWGQHKSVEVRSNSLSSTNQNVGITARFANQASTTSDFETLTTIWVDFYHNSQYISQWERSEHKGEFVFVDQTSQKELLKVPYNLKIEII